MLSDGQRPAIGHVAEHGDLDVEQWIARGRKTIEGYLLASRGPRKRDYGLFGSLVADALESCGAALPRWPDLHSVWFGWDSEKDKGHQFMRPFLRYKRSRPIDGLHTSCSGHRVELTCTVGERWSNGLGAYITRAVGQCLECGGAPVIETPTPLSVADVQRAIVDVRDDVNRKVRDLLI